MQVLTEPAPMQAFSDAARASGRRVVVVPTMGALHDGHLALVDEARRHGDVVVVTIFVNPMQFNQPSDFDAYPRPIDDDLALCASHHVDAVYAPTASRMYPPGFETSVEPGGLADLWEGESRPGHFRGVTTVVTKLFAATRPHAAVFGQKDFQQLAIIRRMTLDLDLGIEIVGMPTVRESDGVAMSSRNRRLDDAHRAAATCISRGLRGAVAEFAAGERSAAVLAAVVADSVGAEPLARLEYAAAIDGATLREVTIADDETALVVAAWLGDVRLIDNHAPSMPWPSVLRAT